MQSELRILLSNLQFVEDTVQVLANPDVCYDFCDSL